MLQEWTVVVGVKKLWKIAGTVNIIVFLYFCLVAAAVVVNYDDVLFFSFCFCFLLQLLLLLFVCLPDGLFVCIFLLFLLLSLSFLDFSLGSAYL